jgi:tetratricopeptide (TPR) repeat protein
MNRRLHLLAVAAIGLAIWAAFAPALSAGFVSWDDGLTVTDNYAFRGLEPDRLYWMLSTSHAGHYQPLSWLSLALDHRRLGLSPPDFPEAAGFHATNLVLHWLGAVLLYALGLRVFALATGAGRGPVGRDLALAVGFATLLHAIHPLRCESVCWVTERRDVLSAPLFWLCLLAYLWATPAGSGRAVHRGWLAAGVAASLAALALAATALSLDDPQRLSLRGGGAAALALAIALVLAGAACMSRGTAGHDPRRAAFLALSLACLLASLLAKAWGIVVPALLLVLDFWPLRRLSRASWLPVVLEKLPFAALSLVFASLARWAQVAQQGQLDAWAIHTWSDRVVQALYGIAFYPAKTLWPAGLSPLYPIPDAVGLAQPRFALAALVTLAAAALAFRLRRSQPWWLAAFVGYVAIVSPVLGLQQSGPQLVADRYAYLAGVPLAWIGGGALLWALQRTPGQRRLVLATALALLALLGALCLRQSRIWHDSETLWTVAHARAPESPLASLNLGLALAARAEAAPDRETRARLLDRALARVREAASRRPAMGLYAMNEAILLAQSATPPGAEPDRALLARAIDRGAEAIALAEATSLVDASWHWHQGRMLVAADRLDDAAAQFERALALRPQWPPARRALARALLESARRTGERDPSAALERVDRALAVLAGPQQPEAETGSLHASALALRASLIWSARRAGGPEAAP